MGRFRHMSQSIEGPLMNWTWSEWTAATEYMHRKDGSKFKSAEELKAQFLKMHADGFKRFPIGECDNYGKDGMCNGHEQEDATT